MSGEQRGRGRKCIHVQEYGYVQARERAIARGRAVGMFGRMEQKAPAVDMEPLRYWGMLNLSWYVLLRRLKAAKSTFQELVLAVKDTLT